MALSDRIQGLLAPRQVVRIELAAHFDQARFARASQGEKGPTGDGKHSWRVAERSTMPAWLRSPAAFSSLLDHFQYWLMNI